MILFKNKMSAATESFDVAHDGLAVAMFESSREFSELQGGIPVALSNVYEMSVMDSSKTSEEKEAVLEGVLSDAWEKIKNFFKKIADKIRSWFKNVVKFFQTIFMSNKKFIAKFKEELFTKDGSKFEYKGHKWTTKDSFGAKIKTAKTIAEKAFDAAEKDSKSGADSTAANTALKVDKMKKDIDAAIGVKSVGDMLTKMTKELTGGDPVVIKHFSVVSVADMVKYIEDEKDAIDQIKDEIDTVADAAETYGDSIEKLRSAYESNNTNESQRTTFVQYANKAATVAKYQLSYSTAHLTKKKDLLSKAVSEFSSVLRSFARYKPAKEDYIPEGASGAQSLLEAYMIDA